MPVIPESQRQAELVAYGVLDTAAERVFDDIVRVAAEAAGCSMALVSLLDEDRQWFKARHGMDAVQTPRDQAFCEHVLRADAPLVVPDATADPRFADNPLVTGAPGIRFYAGFPLRTMTGAVLGTLCVLKDEPRQGGLTCAQERLLTVLAAQVMTQLELRRMLAQQEKALGELDVALSSYRALADHATDVISRHAPDGTTLYASPSMRQVLGYDPEQEVGRSAPERVHPDDAPDLLRALGEVLGGAPSTASIRTRHADGTWRHMEIRLSPVCDESGAVVQVHSVARDATDRHEVQERLRLSEERSRLAFEEAPIGIALVAPDGAWLRVNQVLCDIVGYPSEQLLSLSFQDITHPDDLAVDQEQVRQMLVGEIRTYQMDKRYHHARGHVVWVQLNVSLVHDDQGEPLYFVAHIQDITSRKAIEAQLRDSEERFRRLASTAPIGIFQTDEAGRCTYANATWAAICGVRVDVVPGREWTSVVHPHDIGGAREAWRQALENPVPFLHRFRAQHGDGAACWVDVHLIPLPPENGHPPGWVGTATDVTPVIKANLAIAEARDEALRASQLKSQFLANMSHEIRTPMSGVLGMTEMLLYTALDPRQREYAEIVQTSGDALLAIINDILDLSKIEAGGLDLESIDFDLTGVIDDIAELLADSAHAKGLELVVDVADDLPVLRGDPGRLRQVLTNLIGNAVKFTSVGHVKVSARIVEATEDRTTVRLQVDDTGIGIEADQAGRVFEPFTQADSSTTRQYGGTGLGLAITSQLVEMMGGRLALESQVGEGSSFGFDLSLPRGVAVVLPLASADVDGLRGTRVLIVDDNATNRTVLHEYLAGYGMTVEKAESGFIALDATRSAATAGRPFALVVSDMHMPGMTGVELATALAADPVSAGVPMVLLTSSGDDREIGPAPAGISERLTKPVRRARLRACLAQVLARAAPAAAAGPGSTGDGRHAPGRGLVLLVEDNIINQKVAAAMLGDGGYLVDLAVDGEEALRAVQARQYDIVLMDCQMPRMDGYRAAAAIRMWEGEGRHVPIVALTANAMDADRSRALAAGMDDYLAKPVKKADILATVRRWQANGRGDLPDP